MSTERGARDAGFGAGATDQVDDGVAVVASISDDGGWDRQPGQQLRHGCHIGGLARREQQPHRQTVLVDDGVDLGAQSSTRTANGVIRAPFFPPAACWWARMIELSIKCIDCGDLAASVSKMRNHTPAFAHLL
jgi:hypothetical protein